MPANLIYFIVAYLLIFICLGLYILHLVLQAQKIKQKK